MSRGAFVLASLAALVVAAVGVAASRGSEVAGAPHELRGEAPFLAEDLALAGPPTPLEVPLHVRTIISGGGPSPELDQVSLEDDVVLASEVLGNDDAIVLFAGGPGTRAVQVRDDADGGDPLTAVLGGLFAPRGGRDARYRPTRLALHGGATVHEILGAFESALGDGTEPLFFYFAGHGTRGETEQESLALTWDGVGLDPPMLAEALESSATRRQTRIVVSACYAGGFAELAFQGADVARGATEQDRCGIFATAWDHESGGCDSDPDRGVHEGFGVHFLSALRGQERDGTDAARTIDLDHDGAVTLLEALAHTRIASRAIDVPITTSERLLRATAPAEGPGEPVDLPEERAVIDALTAALRLGTPEEALELVVRLGARKDELDEAIEEAFAESDDLATIVAAFVLSRWPMLDDPYHPDYAAMLSSEHDEIQSFFDQSEDVASWVEAEDEAQSLVTARDALEVQIAVHQRIAQALETLALAGRLRAVGGEAWARYERMRACEATVP